MRKLKFKEGFPGCVHWHLSILGWSPSGRDAWQISWLLPKTRDVMPTSPSAARALQSFLLSIVFPIQNDVSPCPVKRIKLVFHSVKHTDCGVKPLGLQPQPCSLLPVDHQRNHWHNWALTSESLEAIRRTSNSNSCYIKSVQVEFSLHFIDWLTK